MAQKKQSTTQKSTKKKTGRQQTNKSSTKKRTAKKKVFTSIPEEKFFVLVNGKRLKHFVDLAHELEHMSKDVLDHHVNEARHDFANWIRDVFDEHELAEEVSKKKKAKDVQITIYKYVITKHLH